MDFFFFQQIFLFSFPHYTNPRQTRHIKKDIKAVGDISKRDVGHY